MAFRSVFVVMNRLRLLTCNTLAENR